VYTLKHGSHTGLEGHRTAGEVSVDLALHRRNGAGMKLEGGPRKASRAKEEWDWRLPEPIWGQSPLMASL
jgi:hypothetical protein